MPYKTITKKSRKIDFHNCDRYKVNGIELMMFDSDRLLYSKFFYTQDDGNSLIEKYSQEFLNNGEF
jgi:hypothetical protein